MKPSPQLPSGHSGIYAAGNFGAGMVQRVEPASRLSPTSNSSTNPFPLAIRDRRDTCPKAAFTLIELIGVVAVIFILALAVMPAMLRQLDDVERAHEEATLQTLGGALRSYVLTTRIVPGTNTIAADLATQLGWAVADVQTNGRGVRRFFIPDPDTRFGTNRTLPYIQTNILNLPTNQPTNRFMIISTMRSVLPASVFPGCSTNTVAFSNAWASADGVRPTSWTDGDWSDILIQRVDLKRLFTQVVLNSVRVTNGSLVTTNFGEYSIDNTNNHVALSPTVPLTVYLLQGTRLGLHTNGGALQVLQIIQGAAGLSNCAPYYPGPSFVFERGAWRGKLFLTPAAQDRTGVDLQSAYDLFMSGPVRANAGAPSQAVLTGNFQNYMSNSVNWAAAGFPTTGTKTAVSNSLVAIKSDLGLYCK